jgi:CHASE3 domain sensor protein
VTVPESGSVTNRELYDALNGLTDSLRSEMREMRTEILGSLAVYRASATCDERHKALDADVRLIRRVGLSLIGGLMATVASLVVYIFVRH